MFDMLIMSSQLVDIVVGGSQFISSLAANFVRLTNFSIFEIFLIRRIAILDYLHHHRTIFFPKAHRLDETHLFSLDDDDKIPTNAST